MLDLKFDKEIHSKFEDIAIIDYGIVEGDNIIVFIKSGQNGSLYGYQNKYIKMARRLNEKYGCSVICSSNPFDGNNPLDNAMEVIDNLNNEELSLLYELVENSSLYLSSVQDYSYAYENIIEDFNINEYPLMAIYKLEEKLYEKMESMKDKRFVYKNNNI